MSKNVVIWCNNGWFGGFHYGFCPSAKAWKREMKNMNVKTPISYPTTAGRCSFFNGSDNEQSCIVTVADEMDTEKDPAMVFGVIAHEAVHVWQTLMERIGEEKPSDEFEAYSVQAITQHLAWAYRDSIRKPIALQVLSA